MRPPDSNAFSLVEVVLAIGIVVFSILALVALMPVGLQLGMNSTVENRAVSLASAIAADLKDTPAANSASARFGIAPLPWKPRNAPSPAVVVSNPALVTGSSYTFWATEGQDVTTAEGGRYRVTLRYLRAPGQNGVPISSPAPIESILVVSWPPAIDPFAHSGPLPEGRVEMVLTFPRP